MKKTENINQLTVSRFYKTPIINNKELIISGVLFFKQTATLLLKRKRQVKEFMHLKENQKHGFQNSILIKGFFSKHNIYISKVNFKIDRKSININSLQTIKLKINGVINGKVTNHGHIIKIVKK